MRRKERKILESVEDPRDGREVTNRFRMEMQVVKNFNKDNPEYSLDND